jgi:hypothetical protein
MADFETKDSGERAEFDSGMVRDTEAGKARFDLIKPKGVPYKFQMLTRLAELMARGAEKYAARNWEKANSQSELDRYYSSADRHFQQWITGETDEDHAAAVMFNIIAAETVKYKMKVAEEERQKYPLRSTTFPSVVINNHVDNGLTPPPSAQAVEEARRQGARF